MALLMEEPKTLFSTGGTPIIVTAIAGDRTFVFS